MSRYVKTKGTEFLKAVVQGGLSVPSGSTAERSGAPLAGELRFNSDTSKLEVYNGSAFVNVGFGVESTITQDSFTGDGSTAAFTMSKSVVSDQEQRIVVAVGNVYQNPAAAYTVSGTTITFTSAPGNAETITIVHGFDSNA